MLSISALELLRGGAGSVSASPAPLSPYARLVNVSVAGDQNVLPVRDGNVAALSIVAFGLKKP